MGTIAALVKLSAAELMQIRAAAPGWTVLPREAAAPEAAREAEIWLGWDPKLEAAALDAGAKVRWIQSWSAGVDKMPIEALLAKGIEVSSANGVHAYPISETIFAMLLFFQAEDGIRVRCVTGVQTCALPISRKSARSKPRRFSSACSRRSEIGRASCRERV